MTVPEILFCGQCGSFVWLRACGPTHAARWACVKSAPALRDVAHAAVRLVRDAVQENGDMGQCPDTLAAFEHAVEKWSPGAVDWWPK